MKRKARRGRSEMAPLEIKLLPPAPPRIALDVLLDDFWADIVKLYSVPKTYILETHDRSL